MENSQSGGGNVRPDSDAEAPASSSPAGPADSFDNDDPESGEPLIRPASGSVARGSSFPESLTPAEPAEGDSSYPDDVEIQALPEATAADQDTSPDRASSLTSLAREASADGPAEYDALEPQSGSVPASSEEPAEHTAADTFHRSDYDDPYEYGEDASFHDDPPEAVQQALAPVSQPGGALTTPPAPPPAPPAEEEEDSDDGGMLRMSFLEHLEELRSRIIKCLIGVAVAFGVAIFFSHDLWQIVSEPAAEALASLGYENVTLVAIKPTEQFNVIWVKLPILAAIFLASPWVLYQVWAFIAPGLYKRERRWAAPFVTVSAGLFILGGLFAYYVAFRFGLTFLLGIGRDIRVTPFVSIEEYFDLFVNVVLVIGLVFELPVLLFFLTLLHIVSPRFLIRNTRYAVLGIVILAAVVTPTPDVLNLMLFSVPMLGLYFVGIFASYLLVLQRENRRFPWFKVALVVGILVIAAVAVMTLGIAFGYFHLIPRYPFLVR